MSPAVIHDAETVIISVALSQGTALKFHSCCLHILSLHVNKCEQINVKLNKTNIYSHSDCKK